MHKFVGVLDKYEFWGKSHPQHSCKNGPYIKKSVITNLKQKTHHLFGNENLPTKTHSYSYFYFISKRKIFFTNNLIV